MPHPLRQVHRLEAGKLVIRPVVPDQDAAPLLAIQREVLSEGRFFITEADELVESPELKAITLQQLLDLENSCCFVAVLNKEVVGMVLIQGGVLRRMRHSGKLEIYLCADARGHGVGSRLVAAALEWAVACRRLSKVGLNVFAHNERAQALYRAHGFVEEGRRVAEYRLSDGTEWDDVLMARRV